MPLLGAFLTAVFLSLAQFFVTVVGRKYAAVAAGVAMMLTLVSACYAAIAALALSVSVLVPAGSAIATGFWLAMPDNGPACIAIVLAGEAVLTTYRLNVLNVKFGVMAS